MQKQDAARDYKLMKFLDNNRPQMKGMWISEIAREASKRLGYDFTDAVVRKRCQELEVETRQKGAKAKSVGQDDVHLIISAIQELGINLGNTKRNLSLEKLVEKYHPQGDFDL